MKNAMADVMGYKPARLYQAGSRMYIGYYIKNPSTGQFERKRIYVNGIKDTGERRRYIADLIRKLNEKLREGWNPLIEDRNTRIFSKFVDVLDEVYEYKKAYVRKRTGGLYKSRVKILKEWLAEKSKMNIWVYEFDERMARDFMDWIMKDKKARGRSYNNYLLDYKTFFKAIIMKGYLQDSPFKRLEKMPEESKIKQPFDREQSEIYVNYLKENDYDFFIISGYTYYCALRPNEIVQLRIKNINIEKQYIDVPAEISKNRRHRKVVIADEFLRALEPYINKYPSDYFLCSKNMIPGKIKIAPNRIAEHFRIVADRIGLPNDIYFYSLKDTCAERLIEAGYSVQDVRDLFGHSSVAMTDNYLKRRNAYQNERLKKNFPKL